MSLPINISNNKIKKSRTILDEYGEYKVKYWINNMPSLSVSKFDSYEQAVQCIKELSKEDQFCIINKKWSYHEIWSYDKFHRWTKEKSKPLLAQSLNSIPVRLPKGW